MMPFKVRIFDEKTATWDMRGGFLLYPDYLYGKQGRIFVHFTGIKDSVGIEIFEGDKVEYFEKLDDHGEATKHVEIVTYDAERGAFMLGERNYFTDMTIFNFTVVGNKFDVPYDCQSILKP